MLRFRKIYQTTRRHVPEYNLHCHRRQNLIILYNWNLFPNIYIYTLFIFSPPAQNFSRRWTALCVCVCVWERERERERERESERQRDRQTDRERQRAEGQLSVQPASRFLKSWSSLETTFNLVCSRQFTNISERPSLNLEPDLILCVVCYKPHLVSTIQQRFNSKWVLLWLNVRRPTLPMSSPTPAWPSTPTYNPLLTTCASFEADRSSCMSPLWWLKFM